MQSADFGSLIRQVYECSDLGGEFHPLIPNQTTLEFGYIAAGQLSGVPLILATFEGCPWNG